MVNMKINEVIVRQKYITWELLKESKIVPLVYDFFNTLKLRSINFTIPAHTIYNEFEITDLIIDLSNYKNELSKWFNESAQVMQVLIRLISYLEYNELD